MLKKKTPPSGGKLSDGSLAELMRSVQSGVSIISKINEAGNDVNSPDKVSDTSAS